MTTDAKYWAVVPAAGVGKRMQSAVPKQYLKLHNQFVIDHTIGCLLAHSAISGVVVALGVDDEWWLDTKYANHADVVRADGGKERCDSVLSALHMLSSNADASDWVLVHDAARPCLRHDDIDKLILEAGVSAVGGLLGMPVKDTMKRTKPDNTIIKTIDREQLWHAFTPQMFRFGVLRDCLQQALNTDAVITDEASAMEWAGLVPVMVEGRSSNIKITRPEDLSLAGYFLSSDI